MHDLIPEEAKNVSPHVGALTAEATGRKLREDCGNGWMFFQSEVLISPNCHLVAVGDKAIRKDGARTNHPEFNTGTIKTSNSL